MGFEIDLSGELVVLRRSLEEMNSKERKHLARYIATHRRSLVFNMTHTTLIVRTTIKTQDYCNRGNEAIRDFASSVKSMINEAQTIRKDYKGRGKTKTVPKKVYSGSGRRRGMAPVRS